MTYSKSDVDTHTDGHYGPAYPAVNVKVYGSIWTVHLPLDLGSSYPVGHPELIEHHRSDPEFTRAWIKEHVSEAALDAIFWDTCNFEWEVLQDDATDIFDGYRVTVNSAGRSGGWAIVRGLPDIENWDAVLLAKWRRFEKLARGVAAYIPEQMLHSLYVNEFEAWRSERDQAQADIGAALFI